jgi:hypothetical protein
MPGNRRRYLFRNYSLEAYRQQIRQSELIYRQKLNDNLLQSTKQYIDTLYIPINRSLTRLETSYELYGINKLTLWGLKRFKKSDQQSTELLRRNTKKSFEDFMQACKAHKKLMKEITDQGTDIYLTMDFDKQLNSFNNLLEIALLQVKWTHLSRQEERQF